MNLIRPIVGKNVYRIAMVTPLDASYDYVVYSNFIFLDHKKYNPNNKIIILIYMYLLYDFATKPKYKC